METSPGGSNQVEYNEEYVLLDLDNVCIQADIPANAPYVLSGLDTLNPTLTIGDRLKLIGEYQETIGTCFMFERTDGETVMKSTETAPGCINLSKDQQQTGDPNQAPFEQIRPIATVHKVLKFRLEADGKTRDAF